MTVLEPNLSTATLRHTPLAIISHPPAPECAAPIDTDSKHLPPLRFLIHPPDAPAASAYTLPPNGVLATKYIASDLATGKPKYWWTHKAGFGIRVMRAPLDFVNSNVEVHADDLENMCCVSKMDKANVVCAIRSDGVGMFSSKWVLEGGVEGAPVAVKYKCKDKLTDGCKMVFTASSAGAVYPEVRVMVYSKDGIMTLQALSGSSATDSAKGVTVVVAAWMRKDGEMRIAQGVDVEGAMAMFAQAHKWLNKEFFVWEDVPTITPVKY
ncbi:hypothetical protein BCR44DRAFT_39724 [Catenaria anguillulae PL171]|uniref:Uncharacterized protein n=1 Tax=Catenaria anguillulae PL171 TaxID=765915 RepID=A0A1Y2HAV1_9FUNG|nr:hypothetical protein BCR44DRAFT_39724 [Catenaria anguillulae PL171]